MAKTSPVCTTLLRTFSSTAIPRWTQTIWSGQNVERILTELLYAKYMQKVSLLYGGMCSILNKENQEDATLFKKQTYHLFQWLG